MSLQQVDFSKTLTDDQVFECIMKSYSKLSKEWISHQWNCINSVYCAFNYHYKYMIIISLIEKTFQFYDQMNIQYSYDQYYTKSYLQIDKFSISELCEKLNLPKETVRRKVLELEKDGVINRDKKKILIDRKAFSFVKPENQIKISSKYISLVSEILHKDRIYSKKLDQKFIEEKIKLNFTLCWRWYYQMQIPIVIGYDKFMNDLISFHVWGTVCMNQVLNISKSNINEIPLDWLTTSKNIINNLGTDSGVSAMSISEMTNIPRATIIRKCKYLIKKDLLYMNDKKQYILNSMNFKKILPYQSEAFKKKAKFIRKVLNLLVIS